MCARNEAAKLVREQSELRPTSLISICDPGENRPEISLPDERLLCLQFRDGACDRLSQREQAPKFEHIRRVEAFSRELQKDQGVVIHCSAGISRGPAVAWLLCCFLEGPGRERQILEQLLRERPQAKPSPWIIGLAQCLFVRFSFLETYQSIAAHHYGFCR